MKNKVFKMYCSLVLFCVIPCLLFGQNKSQLFSKTELEFITSAFVKAQIGYELMQQEYESTFRGHRTESYSGIIETDSAFKKRIIECAEEINTKKYIHLNNYCDSVNVNNTKVYIFNYSKTGSYEGKDYIIMIDCNGIIYLMHGFYKSDFERYLKDKVKNIKDKIAFKQIMDLYLMTVNYTHYNRIIIDGDNIQKYRNKGIQLEPLKIENTPNGTYKAVFYTIENMKTNNLYDVFYNSFEITSKLIVKSNFKKVTK